MLPQDPPGRENRMATLSIRLREAPSTEPCFRDGLPRKDRRTNGGDFVPERLLRGTAAADLKYRQGENAMRRIVLILAVFCLSSASLAETSESSGVAALAKL